MPPSKPPRKPLNPHLQGLLGILLGVLVVAVVLGLLRWRRDGLVVDDGELSMAATTPCMIQAIRQGGSGGHSITYSQLDRLKKRCGS